MANYSAIKAAVNAYIKQNGRKEITGRILNAVLNATIDSLGKFYQFAGEALPTDDPGTPDQNLTYLAGTAGTYTNFGGLTLDTQEIALLMWDGEWKKQTLLFGIQEVDASVDNQVGTPSVDVDFENNVLTLSFHNIKGDKGDTGDPAGFGQVTASVDDTIGNPSVQVQTSGEDTAKNIAFEFHGLRGETGITSVVASVDNTTGNPACSVSLVGQVLHLDFTGLKGLKGDTGVSADYPITIYNGLDSDATDQALSAAQGNVLDGKIGQLGQEIGIFMNLEEFTSADESGYYNSSTGAFVSSATFKTVKIKVERNDLVLAKLKIEADVSAIGFKALESDTTIDTSCVVPGANLSAVGTYAFLAHKDGYVLVTSRENPQIKIQRLGKVDDTFFQTKYEEQKTVYPILNKATYISGGPLVYNNYISDNTARLIFVFFVGPNTTAKFDLINNTSVSIIFHGVLFFTNRLVHATNGGVNATFSYSSGVATIANNSTELRAVVATFKKTNGSTISSAEAAEINKIVFRREVEADATYPTALTEFVSVMNTYASRLGMSHSSFVSPYGGVPSTSNISCVSDILKMSIFAFGKEYVRRMMAMKSVSIAVLGDHAGTRAITKSTQSTMDSYYSEMHPGETNPYILLGDKGGGWSSGEYKAYSLVAFTKIDDKIVCGVTATTQGDGTTGREARLKGMIELFDIAAKVIRGESITGLSCTLVENAIAAIVPEYPNCYSQISVAPLYSQNPDVTYNPASTSKILSCIIMSDVLTNLQEYHELASEDIVNDSSYTAYAGDIETVESSLYAMMMASNAANTLSLARMAGTKILESKYKYVSQ